MLGLFSFFYLTWHASIYLHLELNWNLMWFWEDLQQRPFIRYGLLAWTLSLLLAITSPKIVRKKLGKRWRQLHRTMYLLSIVAVVHVQIEAKVGESAGIVYAAIVSILLFHRILVFLIKRWYRADDNGLAVTRR